MKQPWTRTRTSDEPPTAESEISDIITPIKLRLRRWTVSFEDGGIQEVLRNKKQDQGKVAVAVVLGYEPERLGLNSERINVEDRILQLAETIKLARKKQQLRDRHSAKLKDFVELTRQQTANKLP